MTTDFIATASITVNAPAAKVWSALTDPAMIARYMFGATVTSEWREGSPIVWKGEWEGRSYEDKGVIKRFEPERRIQYTHFSPLSGVPDVPENYHTVTVELLGNARETHVTLSQDNNATKEARDHSQKNWEMMLAGLKKVVEQTNG